MNRIGFMRVHVDWDYYNCNDNKMSILESVQEKCETLLNREREKKREKKTKCEKSRIKDDDNEDDDVGDNST